VSLETVTIVEGCRRSLPAVDLQVKIPAASSLVQYPWTVVAGSAEVRRKQAPTKTELMNNAAVQRALEDAWADSQSGDPVLRHEEGGWIFADLANGTIAVRRAPAGGQAVVDLNSPPLVAGSVVVATFRKCLSMNASLRWSPGFSRLKPGLQQ
jgi:hypothetical protein